MPTTKPLPVMFPRFQVDNLVKWGYLVKMWSTQEPYPGVPVMPIPRTLAEFRKQCEAVELNVTIPDYMTGFAAAIHAHDTFYLRIPPAAAVKDTETFLLDERTDYPPLAIYNMYSPTPFQIPKDEKLEFHAARIGDYSLAYCQ